MNIIQIEQSNAIFALMIFVARLSEKNNAAWIIRDNMVSTPAIFHRTKNHFVTGCGWYEVRDINTEASASESEEGEEDIKPITDVHLKGPSTSADKEIAAKNESHAGSTLMPAARRLIDENNMKSSEVANIKGRAIRRSHSRGLRRAHCF